MCQQLQLAAFVKRKPVKTAYFLSYRTFISYFQCVPKYCAVLIVYQTAKDVYFSATFQIEMHPAQQEGQSHCAVYVYKHTHTPKNTHTQKL